MKQSPYVTLAVRGAISGPTYVYDLDRLGQRCRRLDALPIADKRIFFAMMANDHPTLLRRIRRDGHGVFVNSPKHLRTAIEVGFASEDIIYAASNMIDAEVVMCADFGIHLVLDSVGQIERVGNVAGPRDIGIRVNIAGVTESGSPESDRSYRFGILPNEIGEAVVAANGAGVRLIGLHCYFGTGIEDPKGLINGLSGLCHLGAELPDLRYVDGGGGFGVPDGPFGPEFDIDAYGRAAGSLMREARQMLGRDITLFIEPGRYISADCAHFLVRVVDRKHRGDRAFVGTDGSVALFPRPLIHPDQSAHYCELLGPRSNDAAFEVPIYVCGNSTFSGDFLARDRRMPLPAIGDILAFHAAGAYCRSMITGFLGKGWPSEIVVEDGRIVECTRWRPERPAGRAVGPRPRNEAMSEHTWKEPQVGQR